MENQSTGSTGVQQPLPNSTGVLVLGILSIVFFICYVCVGLIGLTLGIVALVMAKKANQLYLASPDNYTKSSYDNMKAGKICAIIGICLSSIWVIVGIIYFIVFIVIAGGASHEIFDAFDHMH